ncbi:uncharacterized protein C17orf98-like [Gracilinanus agilis]|uniref:uncharacterized protein C17orf98-like n=1 Tax=Gracilinanus agilis TaxID=191870 RepID=UPI001CFF1317|nr:uncharacterized protein C17orf98-like [Gracilinanus agilis]
MMPKKQRWGSLSKMFVPPGSAPNLWYREKGFILDCIAVDSLSKGSPNFLSNLKSVIPPYNAQKDPHLVAYFATKASPRFPQERDPWKGTLPGVQEEEQEEEEEKKDKMGTMAQYLVRRNRAGAGYSLEETQGHDFLYSSLKPILGYNGPDGYRRNCPNLRKMPIAIGILTHLPIR